MIRTISHPRSLARLLGRSALLLALAAPLTQAANDDIIIEQSLASAGAPSGARAEARWRDKGDSVDFQVELEDISPGAYELWVDGQERGTISVGSFGQGELEFEAPLDPPKPLLNFAVLDQQIEVRQDGTTLFSDVFDGQGQGGGGGGGGNAGGNEIEVFMSVVGSDLNAKGRLRYRDTGDDTRFDAEFEKLDAGSYELSVAGDVVVDFVATGSAFEQFEFEFRNPPEPGHIPLTFDPLGKLVELNSTSEVVLSAVMPGDSASTGLPSPKKSKKVAKNIGKKKRDALKVRLFNLGTEAGVEGDVLFEQGATSRLSLSAEQLSSGVYTVVVDGIARGEMAVAGGVGSLSFASDAELPTELLDFPVKGRLVEVKKDDATVLSTVFPLSVQHALNIFVKEKNTAKSARRNLVNAGGDLDARGVLKLKSKGGEVKRVRLTLRDAPVGFLTVTLGGLELGTVLVKKEGSRKVVTLASNPKGSQLALPLDPSGLVLQVLDAEGVRILEALVP